MQAVFAKTANFTVRQIDRNDWKTLRDFLKSLDKPTHFHGYIKDPDLMNYRDLDDPAIYQALFDDMDAHLDSNVMWGVFDKGRMIGQTSLHFDNENGERIAIYAGSERADGYRGQRIGDMLYEARESYLRSIGFKGQIRMTVREDNPESCKAASRHGFVKAGVCEDGYSVLTLDEFE